MVLFLGGQENGKRIDVFPLDSHVVFHAQQRAIAFQRDDGPPTLAFDKVIYERKTLAFPEAGTVDLFFPSGWSPHWQMKALRDFLEFG